MMKIKLVIQIATVDEAHAYDVTFYSISIA
jgi:hypothetical protein